MEEFNLQGINPAEEYDELQEQEQVKRLQAKIDNAKMILESLGPKELIKSKEWSVQEYYRETEQSIFFFETLIRVRQWDVSQLNIPVNKVIKISIRSLTKELKSRFPDQEFFRAFQSRFTITPVVLMTETEYLRQKDSGTNPSILWRTNKSFESPRHRGLVAVPFLTKFNNSLRHWNWMINTWD